ncbi:MAG TPA: hypothetical protein VFM14_04055 [Gemmatimonadales bacterium]|nr:hypothetical protein [Gemmatimonadales bacterium]
MKVLSMRYASVLPNAEAMARFFDALGLPRMPLPDLPDVKWPAGFAGAIFPAGESWIEIWPQGPEMPVGNMLQIVVDDAEAFAAHAKARGLSPEGPMDAHGERIFFLKAPDGTQISFQSKLPETAA